MQCFELTHGHLCARVSVKVLHDVQATGRKGRYGLGGSYKSMPGYHLCYEAMVLMNGM